MNSSIRKLDCLYLSRLTKFKESVHFIEFIFVKSKCLRRGTYNVSFLLELSLLLINRWGNRRFKT